jgi:transposase-like protein
MPRPRPWADDDLQQAVAESETLAEVYRALQVRQCGKTYGAIRAAIARLELDAAHLPHLIAQPRRRRTWTDDELRSAVASSLTHSEVQRRLGYTPSGGIHRFVRAHIARLGIDTSHFVGQAWMRGRTKPPARRRLELEVLLVTGSTVSSSSLRQKLVRAGLKEARCEMCGISEWNGTPLSLELDHINGDHTDNRVENLRIVCPNCHSITETWCGRTKKPA